MLTEEEKKNIEEKVRYETEIKMKYQGESVGVGNNNTNITNPYTDKLDNETIIRTVIPKFTLADSVVKKIERISGRISLLKQEIEELKTRQLITAENKYFNIFLIVLSLVYYFVGLSLYEKKNTTSFEKFMHFPVTIFNAIASVIPEYEGFLYFITVILILSALFLTPIVFGYVISWILRKIYSLIIRNPILQKQVMDIEQEIKENQTELIDYYEANKEHLAFIPEKYHNSDATTHTLELFQTYRVESMKEAFNKYEEDLHNRKIEAGFINIESTMQNLASEIRELSYILGGNE